PRRLAAGLAHQPLGFLGVPFLVEVRDEHVGAFAREGQGDGPADAAVATGDEGGPAGEPAAAAVGLLAVVGPRPHGLFRAGRLLLLFAERRLRPALPGVAFLNLSHDCSFRVRRAGAAPARGGKTGRQVGCRRPRFARWACGVAAGKTWRLRKW